jgi:ABC-type Fe3+ transport system substrate-binding protein
MQQQYFKENDTLLSIAEKYPETIDVFVSQGFDHMGDETKRQKFGSAITLKTALSLKRINFTTFTDLLSDRIDQTRNQVDSALNTAEKVKGEGDLQVEGLLPCPVRIPLVEKIESFAKSYKEEHNTGISYDLKAASMGLDWLKEKLLKEDSADELSDLFISAGFDLFFEKDLMGKFKADNVFIDSTGFSKLNKDFDNDKIDLKDPAGHYSMIGVVPAVFLVNQEELKGRDVPRSWKDILKPEFAKSISLPIGDFDLFNAILLNIHQTYGDEGVSALGRSLMQSMHPSEMVKSHKKKAADKPVVTIMPYFFTKMVKEGGTMLAIWPEDGAIISPIFMLSKRAKVKELQPVIDFFASKEVGEVLAHKGLFPCINPEVDNKVPEENSYMWLGWDYIYSNDIGHLITHCETTFNAAVDNGSNGS